MSSIINEFNFSFTVMSWNVRGLGDINKCAVVKNLVTDLNCDIISFQETKWSDTSIFKMRQVCPSKYRNFAKLNASGTKGGILLAWSDAFTELQSLINEFSVTIILCRGVFKFMITSVYGPQDENKKNAFLG